VNTLLLALTIAFPRAGASVAYVEKCYIIGAVEPGTAAVEVQGRSVPVYRTGAWATLVDVVEGTNRIEVAGSNHWFVVGRKPARSKTVKPREFKKLSYAGDVPRPHPAGRARGEITIVVDPGHGGEDTGALSPHGIEEKDANLRVATALCGELAKKGYKTAMTRTGDRAVGLYDRPRLAHRLGADAFISIHHNAPPPHRDPNGLRYSAVYAWNDIGERLAGALSRRLAAALKGEIPDNGVGRANYAVTRNPEIPSCLVEVDFITDPAGEEACWNPERRRRVAKALADGVDDWLAE
jgi:N-acetylmuramoyl-L-alanine amidase